MEIVENLNTEVNYLRHSFSSLCHHPHQNILKDDTTLHTSLHSLHIHVPFHDCCLISCWRVSLLLCNAQHIPHSISQAAFIPPFPCTVYFNWRSMILSSIRVSMQTLICRIIRWKNKLFRRILYVLHVWSCL